MAPDKISYGCHEKAWWQCSINPEHVWPASIKSRSLLGRGCPYCSGRLPTKETCLATKNPEIAKEWNYKKNGKITPDNISFSSNKEFRWVCSQGHEWSASPNSRVFMHNGCPYCNGILLKDGSLCNSIPEAVKHIEYTEKGLIFKHNKKYHKDFGKHRYDFYFPNKNKYVEVTSYNEKDLQNLPGRYFHYLRNIVKKRRFVENVLKAKFEFVQFTPTQKQIKKVREWMK